MTVAGSLRDERRIGIFGGTFNPIHRGHLRAAREVASALELERVIFVPSAQPPHKSHLERDPIAPAEDRAHWVELAIADEPLFEINGIELAREGASYSIDTLRHLVSELAPARLVFILGHDAFVEMGTWREPESILALVDLAVVSRPPVVPGHLAQWLPDFARDLVDVAEDGRSAANRNSDTRIRLLEIDALDVSASQIRSDLAHGRSVADRVPEPVFEAIVSSTHYSSDHDSSNNSASNDSASNNSKRGSQVEIVEDAQREKLVAIVEAALERNAQDPVILDVRELTSYTDCLIVMSGNSTRQVRAIVDHVVRTLKAHGDRPLGVEGGDLATWMLIDANDVIVHVFEPDTREIFDIEGLWTDAPRISLDLPEPMISETSLQVPPRTA